MTKQLRVGIDIGGTKVRIGLVDNDGKIAVLSEKIPVRNFRNGDELVHAIVTEIRKHLSDIPDSELIGVGIGSPGPLDATHECVLETPNLVILENYPLVKKMEKHFSVQVKMNNDANVFTLGEAISGAGKSFSLVYGITLGTGYGHGFVWDGRILNGAFGTATEFGLAPYAEGTFEDYISGRAIEANYERITGKKLTGPEIHERALKGEASALACWSLLGRAIGHSLIYVTHLLDPAIVVIGGSLAAGFDLFIDSIWAELDPHLFKSQQGKLQIKPAVLGDAAAIIGAAALIVSPK